MGALSAGVMWGLERAIAVSVSSAHVEYQAYKVEMAGAKAGATVENDDTTLIIYSKKLPARGWHLTDDNTSSFQGALRDEVGRLLGSSVSEAQMAGVSSAEEFYGAIKNAKGNLKTVIYVGETLMDSRTKAMFLAPGGTKEAGLVTPAELSMSLGTVDQFRMFACVGSRFATQARAYEAEQGVYNRNYVGSSYKQQIGVKGDAKSVTGVRIGRGK